MKKMIDNKLIDMTADEIKQKEIDDAKYIAQSKEYEEQDLKKENLRKSAKTKLMNGEALTEEEANVMVGL